MTSCEMSDSGEIPHIAIFPSSGMGHLIPFLRFAASLATQSYCRLTLITTHPTVSLAESKLVSRFLSAFPQITRKELHLLPFDPLTANSTDPFFLQFESISRSAHLLSPILSSSSPPLSAFVSDISVLSAVIPITSHLCLPNYVLFISSASMLSLCAFFPSICNTIEDDEHDEMICIPGLPPISKSWIPPLLHDRTSLFSTHFIANGQKLIELNGIILFTFESLEPESLEALNGAKVVKGLPPVISIGPLSSYDFEMVPSTPLAWLDEQPEGSVVFVGFGSRTAMSREQIRELGEGLVKSGWRFVWVVKDKKVDKEDEEGLEEVVGRELMEKTKQLGLVVKNWVDQEAVLSHPAVGGFVSHCGWNSVVEAAYHGVRMLAWPAAGDQGMIAAAVERSGLGVWDKSWGWGAHDGDRKLIRGDVIGKKINEMMEDEGLKMRAAHVRDEARRARAAGGSSDKGLKMIIEMWKKGGGAALCE